MIKNCLCIMIGAVYICIGYYLFARPEVTIEMANKFLGDSSIKKNGPQEVFYRSLVLDDTLQNLKHDDAYKEFLTLQKVSCNTTLSRKQSTLLRKKQAEWYARIAAYIKAQSLLKLYQMDVLELTERTSRILQRWITTLSKSTSAAYILSFSIVNSEAIKESEILCSEISKKLPEEQKAILEEVNTAIREGINRLGKGSVEQVSSYFQKAITLLLSLQSSLSLQSPSFVEKEDKLPEYTLEELFSLYFRLNKEEVEALHK